MAKHDRNRWTITAGSPEPGWGLPNGMLRAAAEGAAAASGLDEVVCASIVRANVTVRREDLGSLASPAPRMIVSPDATVPGMSAAGQQLADALRGGQRVAVFADYDPDGTCSAAIIARVARALGADQQITWGFADAHSGFGLSQPFVDEAVAAGCSWLVTLDCGSGQAIEIAAARAAGLRCVVVDHHHVDPACAPDWHLNPRAHDTADSPNTGAALTWKLAAAIEAAVHGRSSEQLWAKPLYLAGFGSRADLGSHLLAEHRAMFWLPIDRYGADAIPAGVAALAAALGEDATWPGGLILTSACLNLPKRTTLVDAALVAELLWSDDPARVAQLVAPLVETYRGAQQVRRHLVSVAQQQIEERDDEPLSWAIVDGFEEWAGYAGAVSQDVARANGGVAVCFMRRSDGRYKLAVRGKRAGQSKLGEMLDDEALRAACTLVWDQPDVADTVNLGGHDEVVSGACEAANIEAALAALRPYASREEPRPPSDMLWVAATGLRGDRVVRVQAQARRLAPYNGFEAYYPPRAGVLAEVVEVQAPSEDEASQGPLLVLDSDGVHLRVRIGRDATPPRVGQHRQFQLRLDGADVLWCGGHTSVPQEVS